MKIQRAKYDALFKCWLDGKTKKERLDLAIKEFPNVSPIVILKTVRKLMKKDDRWKVWADTEKQKRQTLKKEKEEKREYRKELKNEQQEKDEIRQLLKTDKIKEIEEEIKPHFFYCPDAEQHMVSTACIFRVFNEDVSFGSPCDKCKRMDKHIEISGKLANFIFCTAVNPLGEIPLAFRNIFQAGQYGQNRICQCF